MSLEEALTIFRKNFYSVRVKVFDDYMIYSISNGSWERLQFVVKHCNILIKRLELPLLAEPAGLSKDTFIIKSEA